MIQRRTLLKGFMLTAAGLLVPEPVRAYSFVRREAKAIFRYMEDGREFEEAIDLLGEGDSKVGVLSNFAARTLTGCLCLDSCGRVVSDKPWVHPVHMLIGDTVTLTLQGLDQAWALADSPLHIDQTGEDLWRRRPGC